MRILAIDIGTGTQDILLFDSTLPIENNLKMVMPSPTKIAEQRIRVATKATRPVVLTGVIQGGGPCHWAMEDHLRAGHSAFATPEAAKTFDDDLGQVARMGVTVVSEDEVKAMTERGLSARGGEAAVHVTLGDLDLAAIRAALAAFDVPPDIDGLALACLDHGAAPPGYSDRLFRFEHLARVVGARNDLRAFAMLPAELPDYLTRARTLVDAAQQQASGVPVAFLDTGPAAALGALQDPRVAAEDTRVVLNLGNMHTLAFHLEGTRIVALFEHHTGEISSDQIEDFTTRLITGDLEHEEVFGTKGHGVFYAPKKSRITNHQSPNMNHQPPTSVTGPQRNKIRNSKLSPYFAAPHGDMMLSGCCGLLVAYAEKHPASREEIEQALIQ
jgi:uncharacterized protein (DUF1786 family)